MCECEALVVFLLENGRVEAGERAAARQAVAVEEAALVHRKSDLVPVLATPVSVLNAVILVDDQPVGGDVKAGSPSNVPLRTPLVVSALNRFCDELFLTTRAVVESEVFENSAP